MLEVATAPLITERLILRPIETIHAAALWPTLSEPELYRWIPRQPPVARSELDARLARISVRAAPERVDQWLNWSIWRRDTDEAIGVVETTAPPSHIVQIAYMLASNVWRRGYASEALRAVLAELERAGAAGFEATIDTRNAASRALAAKLGFHLVETRASEDIIAGAPSVEELWRRDRS